MRKEMEFNNESFISYILSVKFVVNHSDLIFQVTFFKETRFTFVLLY